MRQHFAVMCLSAVLLSFVLAGCCCGGGKDTTVVTQPTSTTTKGQELQDLKGAHDQGAITDEEFQKAKEKVLKDE